MKFPSRVELQEKYYGAKLAKECAHHLIFLNSYSEAHSLGSPKLDYEFISRQLVEHKKGCKGCTGKAVKAIKEGFQNANKPSPDSEPISDL